MRNLTSIVIVAALFTIPTAVGRMTAQTEPSVSRAEMQQFLSTARVIGSRQLSTGVTSPWRLTLDNGVLKHDAAFQSVDERLARKTFADGSVEINFVDSWQYDVAAGRIAGLVGLDGMMPVTVVRRWNGAEGALSWWIPWTLDEKARLARKIVPPDSVAWNQQMHRMRVFSALVDDTDRNLGNVLITDDWKLWMIDFTRAFRTTNSIRQPKDLVMCDRALLAKLRTLDAAAVTSAAKPYLGPVEVKALMNRRARIVALFDRLIAEKGEAAVLY